MARLGFVELVDFGGQDEIALRQAVNFVRPGRDLDFSPGKEDVRVVPLFFRKIPSLVDEFEGFAKVGKLEGLRDVVLLARLYYLQSIKLDPTATPAQKELNQMSKQ
jgi:hypothetical protein